MAENFPEEKYIGSNNNSEDFTPNAYIQIRPNDIGRLGSRAQKWARAYAQRFL